MQRSESLETIKPNLFLIGAPKCGTTALAQYLSTHPQVFFSSPKEPFFWCDDLAPEPHALIPQNLKSYLKLFESASVDQHQIVAEGSTGYLRSHTAVPKILEFQPDAKFIAMLRNPVEVVQAYHMEQVYNGQEPLRDFESAWQVQPDRERGKCLPPSPAAKDHLVYSKIATFSEQIARLCRIVPNNQLKIVIFDDFVADPRGVYLDVLSFVGLQNDGRQTFERVNAAHAQRWPWLSKFILQPPAPLAAPIRSLRSHAIQNELHFVRKIKRFLNVEKPRAGVSPETIREVKAFFARDVSRLSGTLNRNLAHWVE